MNIPILGQSNKLLDKKQENKPIGEPKDYTLEFKIKDKYMKPQNLNFTNTKERVNWTQEVSVNQCQNELDAILSGQIALSKIFNTKQYDIEIKNCNLNKIQVPKLILK